MTYEEWLKSPYRPEDCFGCPYNIPQKARCTYPGKCYYFDSWRRTKEATRKE